jgi:hypothetical protein
MLGDSERWIDFVTMNRSSPSGFVDSLAALVVDHAGGMPLRDDVPSWPQSDGVADDSLPVDYSSFLARSLRLLVRFRVADSINARSSSCIARAAALTAPASAAPIPRPWRARGAAVFFARVAALPWWPPPHRRAAGLVLPLRKATAHPALAAAAIWLVAAYFIMFTDRYLVGSTWTAERWSATSALCTRWS